MNASYQERIYNELIHEVKKRKVLYSTGSSKADVRKGWEEVCRTTGFSVSQCRRRWRCLRDRFKREIKRLPPENTIEDYLNAYAGNWTHFTKLIFLVKYIPGLCPITRTSSVRIAAAKKESSQRLALCKKKSRSTSQSTNEISDIINRRSRTKTPQSSIQRTVELVQRDLAVKKTIHNASSQVLSNNERPATSNKASTTNSVIKERQAELMKSNNVEETAIHLNSMQPAFSLIHSRLKTPQTNLNSQSRNQSDITAPTSNVQRQTALKALTCPSTRNVLKRQHSAEHPKRKSKEKSNIEEIVMPLPQRDIKSDVCQLITNDPLPILVAAHTPSEHWRSMCQSNAIEGMRITQTSIKAEPDIMEVVEVSESEGVPCKPKAAASLEISNLATAETCQQLNGHETEEAENMAFFRTLLPYLKDLSPLQKLRIRTKFQSMLLEELDNI